MPFRENPRIVRGLDYYGHTAFEFVTTKLGAQGTVMGGGRYDGLVEEMGGPPTPAVGWAAGIERLAMLLDDPPPAPASRSPSCRSATPPRPRRSTCCRRCAHAGIRAEMAYRGNLRRRMERANRIGARAAVILGDDDIAHGVAQVKDLADRRTGGGGARGARRAPAMNLAPKLDRIAARADELRDMLTAGPVRRGLREGVAASWPTSSRWSPASATCAPPNAPRTMPRRCSPIRRCANWRKPNCAS